MNWICKVRFVRLSLGCVTKVNYILVEHYERLDSTPNSTTVTSSKQLWWHSNMLTSMLTKDIGKWDYVNSFLLPFSFISRIHLPVPDTLVDRHNPHSGDVHQVLLPVQGHSVAAHVRRLQYSYPYSYDVDIGNVSWAKAKFCSLTNGLQDET